MKNAVGRRTGRRVPLLRLPHVVEQLDHLLVDDEDYGHVQAHPAEPGDGSLIKPAQRGVVRRPRGEKSAAH